jgi:chemotaxis protein MotB
VFIIRRKGNTARESADESSYMASASDLMIGILFIFIILVAYLSFQISKAKTEADPLAQTVRIIGTKLQETKINVGIDEKTGVISLPADILFNSAQYSLKPGGKEIVIAAIKILEDILPCYISKTGVTKSEDKCKKDNPSGATIETIYVEGHTDSAPLTNPFPRYDNWHLGLDRAHTVYQMFIASTMGTYRNDRDQPVFGVTSYADERPARGATKADYDKNRRVELRVVLSYIETR